MSPALELFYFLMFGAAILSAPLLGLAWLIIRLRKIPSGPVKRGLYQGAIIASLLISFAVYELMKR